MKHKWLMLFIFFSFFAFFNIKAKASSDYQVCYYFQDDGDYLLNENINVYYNPFLNDDSYPNFVGYEFVKEEVAGNVFNLYYTVKYHDIIIYGNGGLTSNLEQHIVVDKVKHGSIFTFNLMKYRDLFSYDGYELIKFERNFDNKITVNDDVIINCIWQPTLTYKFIVDNQEYHIKQIEGTTINFPNLVYHDHFIGWFDQNNNIINTNNIIESTEEKKLYAKYIYDFINVTANKIIIDKTDNISLPSLYDNNNQLIGEEDDEKYIYDGLLENKNYLLKINLYDKEVQIELTTRENKYIFKYDNMVIYNSNYKYYLNELEVFSHNGLINYDENLIVKYNNEVLNNYISIDSSNQGNLISSITSHAVSVKLDNIIEYYFLNKCDRIEQKDGYIYFYDLNPNTKYYFIYKQNNDENYYVLLLNTLDFEFDIYDKKIVVHNARNYQIYFKDNIYLPNADDEIIIDKLKSNQEYEIIINHNGFSYNTYFQTNNYISDFSEYDHYTVGYYFIHLKDLPSGYKYYLNKEAYNPIANELYVYNLKPNTKYDLYCVPINSESKSETLFLTFTTAKISSENVLIPEKKISIINIDALQIIIQNNSLHEYSVDKVHWISGEEETIVIDNLRSFSEYILYARVKETNISECSKMVVLTTFITIAEAPSIDCFVDLYYTDIFLSFNMKAGYYYYFDDELIIDKNYFQIDILNTTKKCTLRVDRISDLESYSVDITLRELKKMSEEEKIIIHEKTFSTLIILKSQTNFKYILYNDNNDIITMQKGNGSYIIFKELEEETMYRITILKDFEPSYFYEEEYIMNIYIPGNINEIIDEYLNIINKKRNKKIDGIIKEYTEKINKINSEEEYQLLVQTLKNEISQVYKQQNLYITIIIVFFVFLLSFIVHICRKKSKK